MSFLRIYFLKFVACLSPKKEFWKIKQFMPFVDRSFFTAFAIKSL
ncbi:hypothetical protein HMPREF9446_01217 [Bacteroides fluxus YIT 12057]|uniref:Uncharacterized protein n=1 Tax=Bacteroides fluxus YIT 12057 TaxID=763034 RepID=F3PR69_9BACE|nr:hypothetical protein HMPREF9446_01217 [Bacteroides fluxus YIT 12057]